MIIFIFLPNAPNDKMAWSSNAYEQKIFHHHAYTELDKKGYWIPSFHGPD